MQNPEQAEDTQNVAAQTPLTGDEHEIADGEEEFVPKGAMIFGLVLIISYIIYYFLIWHEVVILRGGA